jgi:hypothetical protein
VYVELYIVDVISRYVVKQLLKNIFSWLNSSVEGPDDFCQDPTFKSSRFVAPITFSNKKFLKEVNIQYSLYKKRQKYVNFSSSDPEPDSVLTSRSGSDQKDKIRPDPDPQQ